MTFKEIWQRLPQNCRKVSGNMEKLLRVISEQFYFAASMLRSLSSLPSLEKVSGQTLDLLGEEEGTDRNGKSDEEFKQVIRFQIASKDRGEDIHSLNSALDFYLQADFVEIIEGDAKIIVVAGRFLTADEKRKIKTLAAAGVGVDFKTQHTLYPAKGKTKSICLSGEETKLETRKG